MDVSFGDFEKFPGIMHNFIKALFRQRAIKAAINFPQFLSGMAPAFKKKVCKGTCMKLPSRRDHLFPKKICDTPHRKKKTVEFFAFRDRETGPTWWSVSQ